MSIINNGLLLAAEAAAAGGYEISRSLRFNSADSAYLSRTPASAGNRKTWTFSTWVKRSGSGSRMDVLSTNVATSGNYLSLQFSSGNAISLGYYNGEIFTTSAVYRDFSAWMHVVLALDTTLATAADRVKLYVNGSRVTTFSTDNISSVLTQNSDQGINAVQSHSIGRNDNGANVHFDGYLADVYLIDGQALDPTSFGEFDTNGVWQPIAYSGSYGTNGFRLTFSDNSGTSSTTLGKDAAGSNNWTPNNFSVAAGSGNDSLVDVPTASGTDTGAGGEVRGNYCTWNAVDNGGVTLSNGNLDTVTSASWKAVRGTIGVSSGKWYWEYTMTAAGYTMLGMTGASAALNTYAGVSATGYAFYSLGGGSSKWNNNVSASYGNSFTTNDVIGVAFDADSGKIWFAKNGTWQASGNPAAGTNAAYSSIPAGTYFPTVSQDNSSGATGGAANFGSRPFAYSAPSGFKALCTTNLPTPTIADGSTAMDVVLWTGDNATPRSITGLGFSPDLVYMRPRNLARAPIFYDIVRGAGKKLYTSLSDAEDTGTGRGYLSSFDASGFTLTDGSAGNNDTNNSSYTYAAWTWDAGSSTVTNTSGSISVQVRANASAGFSIVSFTPASSGAFTVGHGLNATPSLVIAKARNRSVSWFVYSNSLSSPLGKFLELNSGAAVDSNYANFWGTTAFSSTVFGMNTGVSCLSTDNMIAYCFAPVAGYSAFGSYTGNGSSDGPFVYTGFRPRWLMVKSTGTGAWIMHDTSRNPYNASVQEFQANSSDAEYNTVSVGGFNRFDILSNGFRSLTSNSYNNSSGQSYLYIAFAEHPFQTARAR